MTLRWPWQVIHVRSLRGRCGIRLAHLVTPEFTPVIKTRSKHRSSTPPGELQHSTHGPLTSDSYMLFSHTDPFYTSHLWGQIPCIFHSSWPVSPGPWKGPPTKSSKIPNITVAKTHKSNTENIYTAWCFCKLYSCLDTVWSVYAILKFTKMVFSALTVQTCMLNM